jgi:beta-lactamase regulating signal transducer with metallopeptidase domain
VSAASAAAFGTWLLRTSAEASVLIALVFALRFALRRRLSPRWQYALWLLVVLRLALPALPASPTSVFNWLPPNTAPTFMEPSPPAAPAPVAAALAVSGAVPPSAPSGTWRTYTPTVLLALWAAVALLLLARLAWRSYRLTSRVCRQRPVTQQAVVDLLEDCKQELGVHIPINVVQSAEIATPALLGFLRPRLLLPERLLETFDRHALRLLFLHELAHVKRRDILVNWVATLAHVLHWFNPLVALAMARMRADRELATDSLVLSRRGEAENRPYGDTLIRLVEFAAAPTLLPGTVGVLEDKAELTRRVTMIAVHRRDAYRWSALAATVLLVLAVTTLTGARASTVAAPAENRWGSAQPAIQPTEAWLGLLDQGQYGQTWDQASEAFRAAIPRQEWEKRIIAVHQPLGRLVSRSIRNATYNGSPAGESVIVKTSASFANIGALVETCTVTRDKDGQWRVAGYIITPDSDAQGPATSDVAPASASDPAPSGPDPREALDAWVALVDNGQYRESWDAAAADFRVAITRDDWTKAVTGARGPLGAVVSRRPKGLERRTSIPGGPDGQYVTIESETAFEKAPATLETATLKLEKDGAWRAVGYFVRPQVDTASAEAALAEWLALVDAGQYGPSWDAASGDFRKAVSRSDWERAIRSARAPLGAVVSRATQSATAHESLPGAPKGRYVLVQTHTSFAHKASATETCTLQLDADGRWRIAGYFIK